MAEAEHRAVESGDYFNAGWMAHRAGTVHYRRDQVTEVFACADRAEAHWRKANANDRERGVAIRLRGVGHEVKGDYDAAIAAYREAADLHRAAGRVSDLA